MLFWCQTCAKSAMGLQAAISPFVNLRSAHLFLRYPYRSGTILVLLLNLSDNINTPSRLLGVFLFQKKFLLFVILTNAVIYRKLLSFIVTYRQLYKKCFNSVIP